MYDIYDITMTRDFPFTPEEASTYTYTVCSYDCTKVTPSVAATPDGKARVTLVFPVAQSSKAGPVKLTVESGIPFTGTTIIAHGHRSRRLSPRALRRRSDEARDLRRVLRSGAKSTSQRGLPLLVLLSLCLLLTTVCVQ